MNALELIQLAKAHGADHMPEYDCYQVFREYGINVPSAVMITDIDHAAECVGEMTFPVVLKIVSPQIIHKSDVGGVKVGIQSKEVLRTACEDLIREVKRRAGDVEIKGVLCVSMVKHGTEVVVGGMNDKQFGPVVMFGMGGIFIEVFKDVAFRLAPLDKDEALRMMESTKVSKILKGARGSIPCDMEALAELIVNLGNLLVSQPEIKEIDINPVMAFEDGYCAVDARIIL